MLKRFIGLRMVAVARFWIRYGPVRAGKKWLFERFSWRYRDFTCRTRFGAKVTGNTEDLIQRHIYYFGLWEPHVTRVIADSMKAGDVFVDVGANIGYYSLLASGLVGDAGQVVAIEASPSIHGLTIKHVALNASRNVRTINAAATDRRGPINVFPGRSGNIGATSIVNDVSGEAPIQVQGMQLAEMLTDDEIARVRVIKIDVEGAEQQVLTGLLPLLPRLPANAALLMEVSSHHMAGGDQAVSEVFATMRANGFTAFEVTNDYEPAAYIADKRAPAPRLIDAPWSNFESDVLFVRQSAA